MADWHKEAPAKALGEGEKGRGERDLKGRFFLVPGMNWL